MTRLERSWNRLLFGFNLEWASVIFSLTWGSWLLYWHPLSYIPGLRFLVRVVAWCPLQADIIWGSFILSVALVRTYAIFINGDLVFRAIMAMLVAFIYTTITLLISMDSYSSTGIPCYGIIAFINIMVHLQLLNTRALARGE